MEVDKITFWGFAIGIIMITEGVVMCLNSRAANTYYADYTKQNPGETAYEQSAMVQNIDQLDYFKNTTAKDDLRPASK